MVLARSVVIQFIRDFRLPAMQYGAELVTIEAATGPIQLGR
jgi:hypothetical protein